MPVPTFFDLLMPEVYSVMDSPSPSTTRRHLLQRAGLLAGGTLIGSTTAGDSAEAGPPPDTATGEKPWAFRPVNYSACAQVAYETFPKGGCMYALVRGIVGVMAKKHGQPYASFPFAMMRYGHGGVGGYGSFCGALNGAAAVFGLFVHDKKQRDELIRSLCSWYENGSFPRYKPVGGDSLPQAKPGSVLCHPSVTRWCKVAQCKIDDPKRKERCARLTADVTARTVDLLERHFASGPLTFNAQADVANCLSCHGKNKLQSDTSTFMGCQSCHPKLPQGHP